MHGGMCDVFLEFSFFLMKTGGWYGCSRPLLSKHAEKAHTWCALIHSQMWDCAVEQSFHPGQVGSEHSLSGCEPV